MRSATEEEVVTERGRVERWRFVQLVRAGFDDEAADVLSVCLDVDLHEAVAMIGCGCSQKVALRILL